MIHLESGPFISHEQALCLWGMAFPWACMGLRLQLYIPCVCRYAAYGAVYVGLELLAVPAIPLTMTSGVIFGVVPGTIVVSVASVAAATLAFLIARYAARDRV